MGPLLQAFKILDIWILYKFGLLCAYYLHILIPNQADYELFNVQLFVEYVYILQTQVLGLRHSYDTLVWSFSHEKEFFFKENTLKQWVSGWTQSHCGPSAAWLFSAARWPLDETFSPVMKPSMALPFSIPRSQYINCTPLKKVFHLVKALPELRGTPWYFAYFHV